MAGPSPRGSDLPSSDSRGNEGVHVTTDRAAPERPPAPPEMEPAPLGGSRRSRIGDRIFRGMSSGSATLVLIILAAIAIFLLQQALPAIHKDTVNFITYKGWSP